MQSAPQPAPVHPPQPFLSRLLRSSRLGKALVLAALIAAGAVCAYRYAERAELAAVIERASHRLEIYEGTLNAQLTRYDYLPALLSLNPDIVELLQHPDDAALTEHVNRYLGEVTADAKASAIYVMNRDGTTLAASNWNQPISFVGQNFSFRPYFANALRNGTGRFYGLGSTSRVPGYFYAARIVVDGKPIGVVATKIDLDQVETLWKRSDETVLVADANGIVFLTSFPGWKFHTLHPLSASTRARIDERRQYGGTGAFEEVGLVPGRQLAPLAEIDELSRANPFAAARPHEVLPEFVVVSRRVAGTDWRIMSLSDVAPARRVARYAALVTALALALAAIGALYLLQRRRAIAHRLAMRETLERLNDELERKVARRTEALSRANNTLRKEIAEHQRTEKTLKATLEELVQAGKMALLGQMSAGITHELNQPLAALRTLSDNALLFLERGRVDHARENLSVMTGLVERMGAITAQLKRFARKAPAQLEPVDVERAIGNALFLMELRLRKEQVDVVREPVVQQAGALNDACAEHEHDGALLVLADANRLEQVLVNLVANALDAMLGCTTRRLTIGLCCDGEFAAVAVADTGTGIPAAARARLFEPFFTTKPQGAGLGLGLAISSGIVREFGGTLEAGDAPGGGACFTVRLRRARHDVADEPKTIIDRNADGA